MSKIEHSLNKISISRRLRMSATGLVVVCFLCVGFVIDHAYQASLLNAVESRLQAHIYTLLTLAEVDVGEVIMPDALAETRFNQFDSGLYAFVLDAESNPVWQSKSSQLLDHVGLFDVGRSEKQFVAFEVSEQGFNGLGQGIVWQDLSGYEVKLTFWVMEDADYYAKPLAKFRWILWSGLLLVAVLMHVGLWGLLGWALTPLNDLAKDVSKIETGELEALSSQYPRELKQVSQALNLMLAHERQQIERYKLTLADLAHSLKTPISVVQALLEQTSKVSEDVAQEINQQIARMNQSVSYHLKRPVHQSAYAKTNRVLLAPSIYRVVNALTKVYSEKNMKINVDVGDTVLFPGSEDDLFELLGNLLENGFKYGHSQLHVFAQEGKASRYIDLVVDDDGPGIPPEKRSSILKRGVRLDSCEEGQGLGLALVKDILQNFGTKLEIGDSPLGGARFKIRIFCGQWQI